MHQSRTYIVVAAALLLVGCGTYRYAGQEGRVREDPKVEQNVEVVEVEEDPEPATAQPESDPKAEPDEPPSPCGVETFQIYYFGHESRVAKTIDCRRRKIVSVERTPMGQTTYQDAREAGLPENRWYVLVDPKGVRTNFLTNDTLLKLSGEFEIEYFGRDTSRDLLVYTYEDDVK